MSVWVVGVCGGCVCVSQGECVCAVCGRKWWVWRWWRSSSAPVAQTLGSIDKGSLLSDPPTNGACVSSPVPKRRGEGLESSWAAAAARDWGLVRVYYYGSLCCCPKSTCPSSQREGSEISGSIVLLLCRAVPWCCYPQPAWQWIQVGRDYVSGGKVIEVVPAGRVRESVNTFNSLLLGSVPPSTWAAPRDSGQYD